MWLWGKHFTCVTGCLATNAVLVKQCFRSSLRNLAPLWKVPRGLDKILQDWFARMDWWCFASKVNSRNFEWRLFCLFGNSCLCLIYFSSDAGLCGLLECYAHLAMFLFNRLWRTFLASVFHQQHWKGLLIDLWEFATKMVEHFIYIVWLRLKFKIK